MNNVRGAALKKKKAKNADAKGLTQMELKCAFSMDYFCQFILLFSLFLLLLMVPMHFLVLFIDFTVLFQLTFIFIYYTFNKKF